MRRHEHRHLAVLQAADADALEPARMPARLRFGIGGVEHVVLVDRNPADAGELVKFADKLAVLGQDLDAVVVAVGHSPAALGDGLHAVRGGAYAPRRARASARASERSALCR